MFGRDLLVLSSLNAGDVLEVVQDIALATGLVMKKGDVLEVSNKSAAGTKYCYGHAEVIYNGSRYDLLGPDVWLHFKRNEK